MQFMLMFKETAAEYGRYDDPAARPAYFGAWGAYVGAIQQAGIVKLPGEISTTHNPDIL